MRGRPVPSSQEGEAGRVLVQNGYLLNFSRLNPSSILYILFFYGGRD